MNRVRHVSQNCRCNSVSRCSAAWQSVLLFTDTLDHGWDCPREHHVRSTLRRRLLSTSGQQLCAGNRLRTVPRWRCHRARREGHQHFGCESPTSSDSPAFQSPFQVDRKQESHWRGRPTAKQTFIYSTIPSALWTHELPEFCSTGDRSLAHFTSGTHHHLLRQVHRTGWPDEEVDKTACDPSATVLPSLRWHRSHERGQNRISGNLERDRGPSHTKSCQTEQRTGRGSYLYRKHRISCDSMAL